MPPTDHATGEIPLPAQAIDTRPVTPRARLVQIVRFGLVGVLGTAVNVGILHLLHNELGWGFTRSSAIATEIAIVHNYVWNELWTFHIRQLHVGRLARYNMSSLLAASVTVGVATLIKELIDPRLAQLVGILAGAGLNYIVNVRWTWGPAALDNAAE
ncbi:hypothetical protein BH23ACT10_BH23ACT10_13710 [soil metagenome]